MKLNDMIMHKLANIKATLELTLPAEALSMGAEDILTFGGCKVCEGSCDVGCEGSCAGGCDGSYTCTVRMCDTF